MKQLPIYLITFLLCFAGSATAQETKPVQFASFLERLPTPRPTLEETSQVFSNYDQVDKELKTAGKIIQNNLALLYTPLLELFQKSGPSGNKIQLTELSKEEQILRRGFQTSCIGVSEGVKLDVLILVLDTRPLISSGKLSWTKIDPTASGSAQKLYRKLVETEALFNWTSFTKEVWDYQPKFGEIQDENIKAVKRKFDEDLKKLPKKKVKIMEGFNQDVEDPDGTIKLLEQYGRDSHQAFEQWYSKRYKWWLQQYQMLTTISRRLDQIALEADNFGTKEADRSIQPVLADLQGRTWQAWQKLASVTHGNFMDALVEASARIQIQESIKMYKKFKEDLL